MHKVVGNLQTYSIFSIKPITVNPTSYTFKYICSILYTGLNCG